LNYDGTGIKLGLRMDLCFNEGIHKRVKLMITNMKY